MSDLANVKELLNTGLGTEGSLLIEKKIHEQLIQEVDKNLIPRELAKFVVGPSQVPGSSYDINLQTANTGAVRLVAEGAGFVLDNAEYTSVNVLPLKYGALLRITRELMEDAKWPILQDQLATFGRRMAENENSLVIAQLDTAANTVSAGATVLPTHWTQAMQYVEESDFEANTVVAGNEVITDIRNTDTFVNANMAGNDDIQSTGFKGVVYGMRVYRASSNAGMTKTSAYVFDRTQAYCIVEKRTYTVENFEVPTHDMSAAAISQRIAVKALRTSAICKITSS